MRDHFTNYEMRELQALTLEQKETRSMDRIKQFLKAVNGKAYVSFSGGKDSTVLLDLARRVEPSLLAVFSNTGLEYPEILKFVKVTENVKIIKPEKSFRRVLEDHGFPVVSKKVSQIIERFQNPSEKNALSRMKCVNKKYGHTYYLPDKWRFLVNAPFKISAKCCDIMKKKPLAKYGKKVGLYPIIGTMAEEGGPREKSYKKYGCLIVDGDHIQARPLGFWTEKDIWGYIKKYDLSYSKIYDMGQTRTGCMFCIFGVDQETSPNKFEKIKQTHPAQYNYCINKLGMDNVLNYIGIPY